MVSLNWSAPLTSSLDLRQPIDVLPYPDIFDSIVAGCVQLPALTLETIDIRSVHAPFFSELPHAIFFPSRLSSRYPSQNQEGANYEEFINIDTISESIFLTPTENNVNPFKLAPIGTLELFKDIDDKASFRMGELIAESKPMQRQDFTLTADLENDYHIHNAINMLVPPIYIDNLTEYLPKKPFNLVELDVDFDCILTSSLSFVFTSMIRQNYMTSCDLYNTLLETDEERDYFIEELIDIAQMEPRFGSTWAALESKLTVLDIDKQCYQALILGQRDYHQLMRHVFVRIQFYNPTAPALFEVPELPTDPVKPNGSIQLQLELLPINSNVIFLLQGEKFSLCTEQNVIDKIVQELKSHLTNASVFHCPRTERVIEEFESDCSDHFLAPFMELPGHSSPSPVSGSTHMELSPSSVTQIHNSVQGSHPPSSYAQRPTAAEQKSRRSRTKPSMHTLNEFIALTAPLKALPQAPPKLYDTKEIEVAPSDAIMDAIDLFHFAASACTENLHLRGYFHNEETVMDVSTESSRNLFKRIASRLRQCDRNNFKQFAELCNSLQNALVFATLRNLLDILIHSGITLCLKHLYFQLQRADLRTILELSSSTHWDVTLQELFFRLNILFQDVCKGDIRDHPKIDALLEQLEPRTLVVLNHRALLYITLIAIIGENRSLNVVKYDDAASYDNNADVILAFYGDIYHDEKFPWSFFKKVVFYEGELFGLGEYFFELISEYRMCCVVFRVDERHYVARQSPTPNFLDNLPSHGCIIANSNIADQNLDICECLLSRFDDFAILWREKNIPDTSFITSPSSAVILRAIPEIDYARSLITTISDLYVQFQMVTLIVIHDPDAVSQADFIQVQMWLVAGLAPSRVGFQCEIMFATTVKETVDIISQHMSMQMPMHGITSVPFEDELFLSSYPSINPAAASAIVQSGWSLARLLSASSAELKSKFPQLNPVSIDLFYNLNRAQTEQPLLTTTTLSSLPRDPLLSSGGKRCSPEQSISRSTRRKFTANNHRIEDFFEASPKRSRFLYAS